MKQLSEKQAKDFLKTCQWRKRRGGGVEVKYDSEWLHVGRTDEIDDVRTVPTWSSHGDLDSLSYYYGRGKTVLGARVTRSSFYIIDSFTDG